MKEMNIWPALAFDEIKGFGSSIARHFGISERTVRNWIARLRTDPNWQGPYTERDPDKHFALKQDAEKGLEKIVIDYTQNQHKPMSLRKFIALARSYVNNNDIQKKYFNFSPRWASNYLKRHDFTRRRAHRKRRPAASPEDIRKYREKVLQVLQVADGDHVINVDESPWHSDESSLSTWVPKGSEDVIIYGDEKTSFTFIGSLNANNELLPPIFISSGKTIRSENSWFGEGRPILTWNNDKDWDYLTDHTPSGWTNADSWARYLNFLRKYIPNDPEKTPEQNKIYVICDSYKPHFPSEKKKKKNKNKKNDNEEEEEENPDPVSIALSENNIELIKIPEGTTEQCQPLDCRIFGALKSHARKILTEQEIKQMLKHYEENDFLETYESLPISRSESKNVLVECYHSLSPHLLQEAWNRAIFGQ